MNRLLIFVCILYTLPIGLSLAQNQRYEIFVASKKIGVLTVSKTQKGKQQSIEAKTNAEVSILWKHHKKKSSWKLLFEDHQLINSSTISYFNGDLEDSVIIQYQHSAYQGYLHPDKHLTIADPIHIATSSLYFMEPLSIDSVFSERYLTWCKLEIEKDKKYKLLLPDGTINTYSYSGGELNEIYIDRPWFNLKIVRDLSEKANFQKTSSHK